LACLKGIPDPERHEKQDPVPEEIIPDPQPCPYGSAFDNVAGENKTSKNFFKIAF
jgi:hypothetical protein